LLLKEFEVLDILQEEKILTDQEKERMRHIEGELEAIWRMEEMKARQRSRDRNIIEGDKNIAYFQAVANQRNRKKRICGLDGPDGWIDDNSKMLIHAVDFYKSLFGQDESSEVKLDSNFWGEEERVTCEEAKLLEANFSEEEVKDAVFGSYADGAPGPDGLPFLFYQTFWEVIKKDLMRLIDCFCDGDLNLDRLNYGMITLIPKEPEAKTLKKFRPISLKIVALRFLENC
jgi:hypothetical protein